MKKFATYLFFAALLLPLASISVSASGGAGVEHSGANIYDTASLQRGAKWYVNYCFSCHTISYMRYNRLAEDLDLSEEQVMQNLVFSDAKFGETMGIAMDPEQAKEWFGKTPPDLSLIGRSRGSDWLYSYLLGFTRMKMAAGIIPYCPICPCHMCYGIYKVFKALCTGRKPARAGTHIRLSTILS